MSPRWRTFIFAATVVGTGLASASTAVAATLQVDDNRTQCPRASFDSIQPAVDASGPGDTVLVCNGTYPGGVRISGPRHSGLRLRSKVPGGANLTEVGTFSQEDGIVVDGGAFGVEVSGLVIDAPEATEVTGSDGILVSEGSGASRIHGNTVRGDFSYGIAARGEAIEVKGNRVVGYENGGIVARKAGIISGNRTFSRSPNGFAFGTSNPNFDPEGGVVFSDNLATGAGGVGLYAGTESSDRFVFRRNVVRGLSYGIVIEDARGARFEYNRVTNGVIGIFVTRNSTQNRLVGNLAAGNSLWDCRDDSASAFGENTWIGNRGRTSDPPGLCTPGG